MVARRPLVLAAGSVLDADALTAIEIGAAAGFDGIGLRLAPEDTGPSAERDLAALAVRADSLGVAIHDVEVHRIAPSGLDPRPLIDAAAILGARAVLVVSDLPDTVATEHLLGRFAGQCRAAGVLAAVEYMAWTTPASPAQAIELARSTGADIVVDVLHHHRVGAGPRELASVVSSGLLGWVQLADAPAASPDDLVGEARHGRLPPGEGELPLADLLAVVPDDVTICVEVQSDTLRAQFPPRERAHLLASAARAVLGGSP